jgi:putative nucleotidyltransferase with HDIG domain
MMISFEFFKSKFAYRIFTLFILCAIVPLLLLALITYSQISRQLLGSAQDRLHHQALNMGMSIIERCILAESEITSMSAFYKNTDDAGSKKKPRGLEDYFLSVAMVSQDGSSCENILGKTKQWPALSIEQKGMLASGKTIVFTVKRSDTLASIFMCKSTKNTTGEDVTCIAEINPYFLLGISPGQETPFGMAGVSITERSSMIFTTLPSDQAVGLLEVLRLGPVKKGRILMDLIGGDYLSSSAPVFLESRMKGPSWSLVITEPKSSVFNPVKNFRTIFILIFALAFVIVILLSTIQIRRYLLPLERLQEGTLKISQGDLTSRVIINSGDEFDDLAASFNAMTTRIDQQFKTLNTIADIDRAILSEFDFEKIIDTFVGRIGDVCPCDAAGVIFRHRSTDDRWMIYFRNISSNTEKCLLEVHNLDSEDHLLLQNKSYCLINPESGHIPRYLNSLIKQKITNFLALPITINTHMMAIVIMGWRSKGFLDDNYMNRARQITDRVAVAFSNAYLINELNSLNWGTLTALARVVDAKSPWTAGHSERVAAMAFKIGEAMGLSAHQLDILNKAGMLHDIGKVSTPRAILDKKGKLTPEEYGIIQEHPGKGARILEPITPYTEMVPIVRQHHERFDGKGYPDNLEGHTISLGARILAVADTFDAMTSDRPYRSGMDVLHAIEEIRNQSGRQFDPAVVKAFLSLMVDRGLGKECA